MDNVLLLYDGECGFCRWGMDFVRRLDRSGVFRFCPFGHPAAESFLAGVARERRYESYHAVKDDTLFSGTAAARVTLNLLPFGTIAVALGIHRLYPIIASNRGLLGRLVPRRDPIETCPDVTAESSLQAAGS